MLARISSPCAPGPVGVRDAGSYCFCLVCFGICGSGLVRGFLQVLDKEFRLNIFDPVFLKPVMVISFVI